MAYVSPLLTNMVAAVKKVAVNLNRDFSEIERLQTSIKGSLDFTRIAFFVNACYNRVKINGAFRE